MRKLNLVRLADIKEYISLLDREEITMSRFAEILNECANEALRIHDVSGQSEQLCDFLEWYNESLTLEEIEMEVKTYVDMKSHN